MSEGFDDIIRKQLEGLESPVPKDMFNTICNQPGVSDAMFDAGLKNKLQSVKSPIASGLFDKMSISTDLANAPFDEAVQEKLNSYESQVPADMWSRIMREKDRRRPVAWWWVAAGLILLLSGGTWYAVRQSANKKVTTDNRISIKNSNIPILPGDVSTPDKISSPIGTDSSAGAIPVIQQSNTPDQNRPAQRLSSTNDEVLLSIANKKSSNQQIRQDEPVSISIQNPPNKKRIHKLAKKLNSSNETTEDTPEILLNNNRNEKESQVINTLATIHALRSAINTQLRNAAKLLPGQLLKAKPRFPVIPCPVNGNEGRNDWYADIYTSAFMVRKTVADKATGNHTKTGFDSTLQRQVSYNAGISIVKNIGNSVLLKTGVQYNRLNESFRLTRINERKLVTTISVRTVIIAPGDTVYIRDTSVTEHIGTIQRRNQNTYQQWDIPVIIGYEFGGENIRLNANAGIIANIRSSYSGQILDDSLLNVIDAKNYNGKPVYKTNVGFSLYAGLSIIKPLGERTSLIIEPFARMGLQNTTTDNAWFRQKNSSAGISVGLRYKLNRAGQRW